MNTSPSSFPPRICENAFHSISLAHPSVPKALLEKALRNTCPCRPRRHGLVIHSSTKSRLGDIGGIIIGRCEAKTGIVPFGRRVDPVWASPPATAAERWVVIVDHGRSPRGNASVPRMTKQAKRLILGHTPVPASRRNQLEISSSIIQRKVLTPNDRPNLAAVRRRSALDDEVRHCTPQPLPGKFPRPKREARRQRVAPPFAVPAAGSRRPRNPDLLGDTGCEAPPPRARA